jgi:hypothetical protein
MVSIGYRSMISCGPCPHCACALDELWDMWGPFYACEECGYEFDPGDLVPNHHQSRGQPALADGLWLSRDNGSDAGATLQQAPAEVHGLRLA